MKEAPARVMRRRFPVIAGAQTITGDTVVGRSSDRWIKVGLEKRGAWVTFVGRWTKISAKL
jgi:hypothetical protein